MKASIVVLPLRMFWLKSVFISVPYGQRQGKLGQDNKRNRATEAMKFVEGDNIVFCKPGKTCCMLKWNNCLEKFREGKGSLKLDLS